MNAQTSDTKIDTSYPINSGATDMVYKPHTSLKALTTNFLNHKE